MKIASNGQKDTLNYQSYFCQTYSLDVYFRIMITLKSCPICKSRNIIKYREIGTAPHVMCDVMPGVSIETAIITYYFVCQDCHIIFQNPRLSDTELDKYYSTGYYRRTVNMTDEQIDINAMGRAKKDAEIIKQYVGKLTLHLDIGCARGYLLDNVGAKLPGSGFECFRNSIYASSAADLQDRQ